MRSLVAKILGAAGMTGSPKFANSLVPHKKSPEQSLEQFEKDGEIQNPDIWSSYHSVMRKPKTFEESLRLWDEMSNWDLLAAALSEITEEACQTDSLSPAPLWYKCSDGKIEEQLNDMVSSIGVSACLPSQVWHSAGFGNEFEKLEYAVGEGVLGMSFAHPMDVRRYWLKKNRRVVGFRWNGEKPDKSGAFEIGDFKFDRAAIDIEKNKTENLFYPWDFMHIRRMHKSRLSEHGEPLFEEAQGIYKKLRMAIDQMVVHRAQIQPDRYVVNVDVKDQIPADQYKTLQRFKQNFRRSVAFGSGNGPEGAVDEFKSYYNSMALDTILWIARPRDFTHGIEKLAGTASIPDVYDIEMLTNLFFSIIGMPKSWIGLGGSSETGPASGKALLAQDMRFLRKIKSVRQPVIDAYTWLGYFHCLLLGHDLTNLDITAQMSPIGSLEDQMKLEMLKTQAEVLDQLADIMPKYGLPREAWIDVVFKKYLHLPDEVVDTFLTALPAEAPQEESIKKHHKAKASLIIEEVVQKLGPSTSQITKDMKSILDGNIPHKTVRRYKNAELVLQPGRLTENAVVVSGYGQMDPLSEFKPHSNQSNSVTESFTSSPGYRSSMDVHLRKNA